MPAGVLKVLPGARRDIREAEEWYWRSSPEASDGFLVEVGRAFSLIKDAPDRWPLFRRGARRFILERYPFSVVYRLDGFTVWVLAVAHAKRRPEYWRRRKP